MQQKQVALDGSARLEVSLFKAYKDHNHIEPVGQGFGQEFVIRIQKQYQSPMLDVTKIPFLELLAGS